MTSWVELETGSNAVQVPRQVAEKIARHNVETARWDEDLAPATFYPPESPNEAAMANQRLIAIADAREAARASEKGFVRTGLTPKERARQRGGVREGAPHVVSSGPRNRTEAREIHERQATIREARETPGTDPRWAVKTNLQENRDADSRALQQVTRTNPSCAISTNPTQLTHDNRGEVPRTDPRVATNTHPQAPRSTNPRKTPSTDAQRAKKGGCFNLCLREPATRP